jgi:dolichol-phosphate mannosyltransferase
MGQAHPPSLSIVIPCYNEEYAIPRVLPRLENVLETLKKNQQIRSAQVLIVDDHSSDQTASLLKNYPWIESLRMPGRSGYGKALKTGFQQASGDLIAFFDLDGTYDPLDLGNLIATLQRVPAEVVSGERLTRNPGCPPSAKWEICFSPR